MISRYLAPHGLFLMICPLPFHRHTVDTIRALLLDSPLFETHIVPVSAAAAPPTYVARTRDFASRCSARARGLQVPPWLAQGIEEAQVIKHELYVVQWRDPACARAGQETSEGR